MCWSKKVSISMFILGTVFNVLVWKLLNNDKQIKVLILTSQFILFMQLFDAIIWSHQPCSDVRNNKINKKVNVVQMVFNLLQPIVFFALSIVYMRAEISEKNKNIAFIIICLYVVYVGFSIIKQYRSQCSEPVDKHLRYYWWDQMTEYYSGSIFFMVMTALLFLLVVPYKFARVLAIYGGISLLISSVIYGINNSGVVGHMWCFYQVILPLVVYFGYISVVNK